MGEAGVGDTRVPEVKEPQVGQAGDMREAGVRHARVPEIESRQFGQATDGLLELVLDRLCDERLRAIRWDKRISDEEFLTISKARALELKRRLRQCVEATSTQPERILQRIWKVVQPGRGFERMEVYAEIARLRNEAVHSPLRVGEELPLPWEVPPFDYITALLLALIAHLLKYQ